MGRNHLGSYECKLCLTLHTNEGSYLSHTQGKKHQINLARRQSKEKMLDATVAPVVKKTAVRKTVKIGRPGYRATKEREKETEQKALLFEVEYPEIEENAKPRYRFMSPYEQKVEPPDQDYQFLLFAAEPYETIAFKVPNMEIDKSDKDKFFTHWDEKRKIYTMQVFFKVRKTRTYPNSRRRQLNSPPLEAADRSHALVPSLLVTGCNQRTHGWCLQQKFKRFNKTDKINISSYISRG